MNKYKHYHAISRYVRETDDFLSFNLKVQSLYRKLYANEPTNKLANLIKSYPRQMFLGKNGGYFIFFAACEFTNHDTMTIIVRKLREVNGDQHSEHLEETLLRNLRMQQVFFADTMIFDSVVKMVHGEAREILIFKTMTSCMSGRLTKFAEYVCDKYSHVLGKENFEKTLHYSLVSLSKSITIKLSRMRRPDINFKTVMKDQELTAIEFGIAVFEISFDDLSLPYYSTMDRDKIEKLIERYKKERTDVIKELKKKHKVASYSSRIFALTIFLCDGLLEMNE